MINPPFGHFHILLGDYVMLCLILLTPFSAETISLFLSYLVSEIIAPKVFFSFFFYKNLLFDTFEAICTNFLLYLFFQSF